MRRAPVASRVSLALLVAMLLGACGAAVEEDSPLGGADHTSSAVSATASVAPATSGGRDHPRLDAGDVVVEFSSEAEPDIDVELVNDPDTMPSPEMRVSALPAPVEISASGALEGTVTLRFPVDPAALGDDRPAIVFYDETLGTWIPVPTEYAEGVASAEVDHFSVWDVVGWSDYLIQDLLGNRADQPSCSGPLPEWVERVNVLEDRNAPLLACGESDGDGNLVLVLAANRGYSMTLHTNVAVEASEGATLDIGHIFAQVLNRQTGNQTYLPAGGTTTLIMAKPPELPADGIEIRGRADIWSVAGDLAVKALGHTDLDLAQAEGYLSCVVRAIDETPHFEGEGDSAQIAAGVSGSFLTCIDDMGQLLGAAVEASLRRFLIYLDFWDFVGTATEAWTDSTYDLAYLSVIPRVAAFRNSTPSDLGQLPAGECPVPNEIVAILGSVELWRDAGVGVAPPGSYFISGYDLATRSVDIIVVAFGEGAGPPAWIDDRLVPMPAQSFSAQINVRGGRALAWSTNWVSFPDWPNVGTSELVREARSFADPPLMGDMYANSTTQVEVTASSTGGSLVIGDCAVIAVPPGE